MMRDCPDEALRDLLPDYVHGTLPAVERARLASHLRTCVDCEAEVALIRAARAAFPVPSVNVPAIVAILPRAPGDSRAGRWRFHRWKIAAAIGFVALGGISLVTLRGAIDRASSAGSPGAAPAVAPAARGSGGTAAAGEQNTSRTSERVAGADAALSFGGGLSDLTEEQLRTLLREVESLDAAPSAEPEPHVVPILPSRERGNDAA